MAVPASELKSMGELAQPPSNATVDKASKDLTQKNLTFC
jgi:hypothetical protein